MTYSRKASSVQNAKEVQAVLTKLGTKERASVLARFFKTGKGEYGESDVFLGVTVPEQRKVACLYARLPLKEVATLLHSEVHEHRLTALLVLVTRYKKADPVLQEALAVFYLRHISRVNNWDLVDLSAPYILGEYCRVHQKEDMLLTLAHSTSLWKRRVAIVATWSFIRNNELHLTTELAEHLLADKEDLMHKAVGWMLREVGKKDTATLVSFLQKHGSTMPRTMLRYAIEKFPERERKLWLKNTLRKKNQ